MTQLSLDQIALDVALRIDDIFAQGHYGVAQRTSKVQLAVIEAYQEMIRRSEGVS